MNARTLCLAILNFGEATGYEIRKQSVEGDFSYFVDTSFGAIYPALSRLTDEGLVVCRDEVNPGKPARKVYSITPAGRQAFVEALHQPIEPDVFKSPFLMTSMCAEYITPRRVSELIDERIAYMDAMVDMLNKAKTECDHPGSSWTIDYGLVVHNSCRDYLIENRDSLIAIAGTEHSAEAAE